MTTNEHGDAGRLDPTGRPLVPFPEFLAWFKDQLADDIDLESLEAVGPGDLYVWGGDAGVGAEEIARALGTFLGAPYLSAIEAGHPDFRILSLPFCRSKHVVPIRTPGARRALILSNPYDWMLWEGLDHTLLRGKDLAVLFASPRAIEEALARAETESPAPESAAGESRDEDHPSARSDTRRKSTVYDPEKDPGRNHPVAKLTVAILSRAVGGGARDIHLEPSAKGMVVRASIAGETVDRQDLHGETGNKVLARLKALSGMDVAKRRAAQRGRLSIKLGGKELKLLTSTSVGTQGEALAVRILDPGVEPFPLGDLGFTPYQAEHVLDMARRPGGLLLFAGPAGSGKSTSAYSVLMSLKDEDRILASVEDPVEYPLAFGTQYEVNNEEGSSLETLLGRAVAEGPDVLFLGEIQDPGSAKALFDYALDGHLAVSTLSSSNATTALFRLERLGVSREEMAAKISCLVGQRLLPRLCPSCTEARPLTDAEREHLRPFAQDLPEQVGHASGCDACGQSGLLGRVAAFEVLRIDEEVSNALTAGNSIGDIRALIRGRGDTLLAERGVDLVRELVVPAQAVYEELILEEVGGEVPRVGVHLENDGTAAGRTEIPEERVEAPGQPAPEIRVAVSGSGAEAGSSARSVLVAEDDADTRVLLERFLSKAGFRVIQASDGAEALIKIGGERIDLILADLHMPNLDGLKLLEIVQQHELAAPVILLTAEQDPEVEARSQELGATDFLRKPVSKKVLLERIQGAFTGTGTVR